jgi:hypothetical protein
MSASTETSTTKPEIDQTPKKLAIPESFEQTMQQVKSLSDALEKRIETAVNQDEKERYTRLLSQLKQSFVVKSEQAVDGTQESIAKLRSEVSPDQKKLLQDIEHVVKHGVDASVQVVSQSSKDVLAAGTKVADALKSGNIDDAKKQLAGIKETINAAGQKVIEYSGVKALEKVLEPLKTNGIMGIFGVLSNIWKFLTGGMKWSEVVEGASSGVGSIATQAKTEATSAAGKASSALDAFKNMTPEEREKLISKMADGLADDISQKYLGGAKLSVEKVKKVRDIIASSSISPESLHKITQEIEKSGKITIKNLVEVLGITMTG